MSDGCIQGETSPTRSPALALLIDASPLGRTMGNVYFSVARLPMPMRMFAEESKALEWLDGHRT